MFVKHTRAIIVSLIIGIIVSIPLSMLFGSASLDLKSVVGVMLYKLNPSNYPLESTTFETIVWNLRFPR